MYEGGAPVEDDVLYGDGGNDTIDGGEGEDTLYGGTGDDLLKGSGGDIGTVNEGAQSDTLVGGEGDDSLRGGGGNDTYYFTRGDGTDTVNDEYRLTTLSPIDGAVAVGPFDLDAGSLDRIVFGDGITEDDLWISLDGNDLTIALRDGDTDILDLTDKIIVKDWLDTENRIERIEFSGDTSLENEDPNNPFPGLTIEDVVHNLSGQCRGRYRRLHRGHG